MRDWKIPKHLWALLIAHNLPMLQEDMEWEDQERVNNQSAWYYEVDGQQIDSEQCCCFRNPSPHCPIHGKDPNAKPYPRK